MNKNIFKNSTISILFLVCPLPIFFNLSGIFHGTSYDINAFALPLSLFCFLIFFLFRPLGILNIFNYSLHPFLLLVLVWIVSFVVGAILFSFYSPKLLGIYLVPLVLSVCAGSVFSRLFIENRKTAISFLYLSFWCCAAVAFLHVVSSVQSYGVVGAFQVRGADSIFGLFSIYQKLVYYPTLLSFYFIISLGLISSSSIKKPFFLAICVIIADLLIIGSRESIVLILFGFIAFTARKSRAAVIFVCLATLVVAFLYGYSTVNVDFRNIIVTKKIISIMESGDFSAGRSNAIKTVFKKSGDEFNYFFGTCFSMGRGDLRTPHNQYLELLLRSGIIGAIAYLYLIIYYLKAMIVSRTYIWGNEIVYFICVALLALLIVSFNVNTPLRAPLISIPFSFYLSFIGCHLSKRTASLNT